MIGETSRGVGFRNLVYYVTNPAKAEWVDRRGLDGTDLDTHIQDMEAVAGQSQAETPVYHLMLSLPPGETLDRSQWLSAVDRVLSSLSLDEHQAVLAQHSDRDHQHVHIAVNRVHPDTARANPLRHDYARIERACRALERDLGLRPTPGTHARSPEQPPPSRRGSRWIAELRPKLQPEIEAARSWTDLFDRLADHGVTLVPRGRGFVLTDGEQTVKASSVDRRASRQRLEERFGPFADWRREVEQVSRQVDAHLKKLDRWRTMARALDDARSVVRGDTEPSTDEALRAARRTLEVLPGRLGALRRSFDDAHQLLAGIGQLGGRQLVRWAASKAATLLLPAAVRLPLSLLRSRGGFLLPGLTVQKGVSAALGVTRRDSRGGKGR